MLKTSAEADSTSFTQPQMPAAARRKSSIHPLLEEQLLEAADTAGKMQLRRLIEIVTRQYDAYENDRTSLETVMRLASDEATAMTERLERESVVRLQAILDHVKDGIVSVDHLGRIESMNRTAERFFGVRQSDVMSDLIDTLIPDHFVQDTPEGPHVRAAVSGLAAGLLRAHVGEGPQDHPFLPGEARWPRHIGWRPVTGHGFGQSEVEDFHDVVLRHRDVARLEIAVDDAFVVRRLERFRDLTRDAQGLGDG